MKKEHILKIKKFLESQQTNPKLYETEAVAYLRETELPRIAISGVHSTGHTTIKNLMLEGKLCSTKVIEIKVDDKLISALKELEIKNPYDMFHTDTAAQLLAPATNENTIYVIDGFLELCKHLKSYNLGDFLRMHIRNKFIPNNVGLVTFAHIEDVAEHAFRQNIAQYRASMTKVTDVDIYKFYKLVEWIVNDCGAKNNVKLSAIERNFIFRTITTWWGTLCPIGTNLRALVGEH